jgi:hypothetical protein
MIERKHDHVLRRGFVPHLHDLAGGLAGFERRGNALVHLPPSKGGGVAAFPVRESSDRGA